MVLFGNSNKHLLPARCLARAAVPAAALILLIVSSVLFSGRSHVAYAGEKTQAVSAAGVEESETEDAAGVPAEAETDTGYDDGLDYSDGDTGLSLSFNDLDLSEDVKHELNSMTREELLSYIRMIEAIATNPDFNSLMQHHEVRDLLVTLAGDALDFAGEDPDTAKKILETMGVDSRAVIVLFTLMEARRNNPEIIEQIREFLADKQSIEMIDNIVGAFDEDTAAQLFDELEEKVSGFSLPWNDTAQRGTELNDTAQRGTELKETAQTETELIKTAQD